jgi:hypothetical protein
VAASNRSARQAANHGRARLRAVNLCERQVGLAGEENEQEQRADPWVVRRRRKAHEAFLEEDHALVSPIAVTFSTAIRPGLHERGRRGGSRRGGVVRVIGGRLGRVGRVA